MNYNNPVSIPSNTSVVGSSAGNQLRTDYFHKQALITIRKEQYFSQLADTISMPKNMGKTIKRYQYLPMLDDANLNDQGIDAAGVAIDISKSTVRIPRTTISVTNATKASVVTAINANTSGVTATAGADSTPVANYAVITLTGGTPVVTGTGLNAVTSYNLTFTNAAAATLVGLVPNLTSRQNSGNMYGSSKDIGTIAGKMPALSESGGKVNRVGFKRKELSGSIEKFGFYDDYTQETMDFDSDEDLQMHISREMLNGANEMTEDKLQIDLLNNAGVNRYPGSATQMSDLTAASTSVIDYGTIMRLSIDLDNNRTPKQTKVITGTRMIDTKVIPAARIAYIGSELLPTFKKMQDFFGLPAFIPVEKYAASGNVVTGEVGAVDQFRLVVVPEMMRWAGAGAPANGVTTHYTTGGNVDVFPFLVVGDESFTTIGFQTDGKTVKFKIYHKAPGEATADRNDPFGETGFMSIKWYYGFMVLRPERIALIRTAALI